jgi:hypothetical protein
MASAITVYWYDIGTLVLIDTRELTLEEECYRAGCVTTLFSFYQTSTRPTQ